MLVFQYNWLLLLLPAPLLLWKILPRAKARPAAVRVPFGDRIHRAQDAMPPATKARRTWNRFAIPVLVWLLAITAVARPQWLAPPLQKIQPTRDLLLEVDLSSSMAKDDFVNAAGKTVDRLSAVKEVVGEFLAHRKGDRVALVVFGNAAFLQAPFSTDLELSRALLKETSVGMAGPQTAFGDAIGLGVRLFEKSDAPAKTIIALTDGNDTASKLPPIEAARVARQRGIRIHTIAMGNPESVGEEKLDEETLKAVAQTAGGSYFRAQDRQALARIYEELDRIETREVRTISHRPRVDLYYWPLLAALLLSLAARIPGLISAARQPVLAAHVPARVRVNPRTGELEVTA